MPFELPPGCYILVLRKATRPIGAKRMTGGKMAEPQGSPQSNRAHARKELPLGAIAARVPSIPSQDRKASGASGDSSLPIRCVSSADFQDGILRSCGSQFLASLPGQADSKSAEGCLLRPGDLAFSRVGGSFLGIVPEHSGHMLVATENVIVMRLDIDDPVSSAAIGRYLHRGADSQLDALRKGRGRSIRYEDIASISVPAVLVAGREEFAAIRRSIAAPAQHLSDAAQSVQTALEELTEATVDFDETLDLALPKTDGAHSH